MITPKSQDCLICLLLFETYERKDRRKKKKKEKEKRRKKGVGGVRTETLNVSYNSITIMKNFFFK